HAMASAMSKPRAIIRIRDIGLAADGGRRDPVGRHKTAACELFPLDDERGLSPTSRVNPSIRGPPPPASGSDDPQLRDEGGAMEMKPTLDGWRPRRPGHGRRWILALLLTWSTLVAGGLTGTVVADDEDDDDHEEQDEPEITFDMVRSGAAVNAGCLQQARAHV